MEARSEPAATGASSAAVAGAIGGERVAALVRRYVIASTAFLLVAGLLGILMRQSQAEILRVGDNFFYAAMTAHGLGAFVSWAAFAVMGLAYWVLHEVEFPMRRAGLWLAEATYGLMIAGTLGIVVATLGLGYAGSWVFLYPLSFFSAGQWGDVATFLFTFSVLLVGVAIITWCLSILHTVVGPGNSAARGGALHRTGFALGFGYLLPRRFAAEGRALPYPVIPLTVIAIDMIIATTPLAVLLVQNLVQVISPSTTVDPLLAKNVLWFFGHPVVYLLLFPAVAAYYLLIPRYARRPLVAGRIVAVAWAIAVVANVVIWAHHVYLDYPQDSAQGAINLAMQPLTYSITLVSALSLYSLGATIFRSKFEWTPASGFLVAGLFGWITAGLQGVLNATISFQETVHNTLWIVGHFHHMALLNIGLVVFGATYAFLPRLSGREWYSRSLGGLHLWLTLIGGYGSVTVWLLQGLTSAPRRFSVLPDVYDWGTWLSIPFVLMIAAGQAAFVWNLVQTLRGRRAAETAAPGELRRLGWAVGALLFAVLVPPFVLGVISLDENRRGQPAAEQAGGGGGAAGRLFSASCGSCHRLGAAGTTGTVGPDLDEIRPDAARVRRAIERGGSGGGGMPPNLLQGREADQVSEFVARAAGGG